MKTLKKWTRPENYMGPEYPEYYVVIAQTRDSRVLERANFDAMLNELGGETDTVRVIRDSHWACGWLEYILIHESDAKALEVADRLMTDYKDYPVIDEMRYSAMESDEVYNLWNRVYDLRDRIRMCVEHGLSMFAARAESAPDEIYEHLTIDI